MENYKEKALRLMSQICDSLGRVQDFVECDDTTDNEEWYKSLNRTLRNFNNKIQDF